MRCTAIDGQPRFYEDAGQGRQVIVFSRGFLMSRAGPPTSRMQVPVGPPLEAFLARL